MSMRKRTKVAIAGGVLALGLVGAGTALAVSGGNDGGGSVSGPDADHARAAGVAAAPGGQAGQVRMGSDGGAAYDVDVTKPDGTRLDVLLDRNFAVLGTQPAGQDPGGDGGDGDGG